MNDMLLPEPRTAVMSAVPLFPMSVAVPKRFSPSKLTASTATVQSHLLEAAPEPGGGEQAVPVEPIERRRLVPDVDVDAVSEQRQQRQQHGPD